MNLNRLLDDNTCTSVVRFIIRDVIFELFGVGKDTKREMDNDKTVCCLKLEVT